jgi:hypothetical protein
LFVPKNNFEKLEITTIIELAQLYPADFNFDDLLKLQAAAALFKIYVTNIRYEDFSQCKSLEDVSIALEKHGSDSFPLITRLYDLILILPVTTAGVERSFSAMKIIKTHIQSTMGDAWLSDLMMIYLEKSISHQVTAEEVINEFLKMNPNS